MAHPKQRATTHHAGSHTGFPRRSAGGGHTLANARREARSCGPREDKHHKKHNKGARDRTKCTLFPGRHAERALCSAASKPCVAFSGAQKSRGADGRRNAKSATAKRCGGGNRRR
eukprot:5005129-Prymnesium_polylepis.1